MKAIESEELSHKLLKKIIELIPKDEQLEFNKKTGNQTSKKKESNSSQTPETKNKEIKISFENFHSNPDSLINTIDSFNECTPHSKNENIPKKKESKNNSEHISLIEENEEEENTNDYYSENLKIIPKTVKKEKMKNFIIEKKLCGKKRKKTDIYKIFELKGGKSEEKKKECFLLNKTNKKKTGNSNKKKLFKKKEQLRKDMTEKDILSSLVKKEGFMNVFNCLTKTSLNRENSLEKKVDDIINNIGLLRTSLILFQIKFQEIDKNTNINTNNIININSNSNNISSDVPKNDDEIDIIIDEVGVNNNLFESRHIRPSTPSKSRKNARDFSSDFKRNKHLFSAKSKSVFSKIPCDNDLELDFHLQKDKNGNIYKYTKHHYRENKGKNLYVYYCADKKCKSKANYYVKNMKFETVRSHNIKYEEHCYFKNRNRFDKYKLIIDEFEKRECHEAQIFKKENGTKLVKWYD